MNYIDAAWDPMEADGVEEARARRGRARRYIEGVRARRSAQKAVWDRRIKGLLLGSLWLFLWALALGMIVGARV